MRTHLGFFVLFFLFTLTVLRIVLAKQIQKTGWFVSNSVRLALWAAAWALIVKGVTSIFAWQHPAIETLAIAPFLAILLSMFLLVLLEVPAFWYVSLRRLVTFIKKAGGPKLTDLILGVCSPPITAISATTKFPANSPDTSSSSTASRSAARDSAPRARRCRSGSGCRRGRGCRAAGSRGG